DHRPLARDHAEVGGGGFHLLAVVDALADAHVDDDLVERRHLHGVLVAELVLERLAHHLVVVLAQARRDARRPGPRGGRGAFLLVALRRLGGALRAGGLRWLVALRGLRSLVLLRRLVGLVGLRLLGFRLVALLVLVSHRSRLPSAWRCAPSCGRGLHPRT